MGPGGTALRGEEVVEGGPWGLGEDEGPMGEKGQVEGTLLRGEESVDVGGGGAWDGWPWCGWEGVRMGPGGTLLRPEEVEERWLGVWRGGALAGGEDARWMGAAGVEDG